MNNQKILKYNSHKYSTKQLWVHIFVQYVNIQYKEIWTQEHNFSLVTWVHCISAIFFKKSCFPNFVSHFHKHFFYVQVSIKIGLYELCMTWWSILIKELDDYLPTTLFSVNYRTLVLKSIGPWVAASLIFRVLLLPELWATDSANGRGNQQLNCRNKKKKPTTKQCRKIVFSCGNENVLMEKLYQIAELKCTRRYLFLFKNIVYQFLNVCWMH